MSTPCTYSLFMPIKISVNKFGNADKFSYLYNVIPQDGRSNGRTSDTTHIQITYTLN